MTDTPIPFVLSDHDRYRIAQTREALAAVEQLDMSDEFAMAAGLGRLEVAVKHLLDVFDEHEAGESGD